MHHHLTTAPARPHPYPEAPQFPTDSLQLTAPRQAVSAPSTSGMAARQTPDQARGLGGGQFCAGNGSPASGCACATAPRRAGRPPASHTAAGAPGRRERPQRRSWSRHRLSRRARARARRAARASDAEHARQLLVDDRRQRGHRALPAPGAHQVRLVQVQQLRELVQQALAADVAPGRERLAQRGPRVQRRLRVEPQQRRQAQERVLLRRRRPALRQLRQALAAARPAEGGPGRGRAAQRGAPIQGGPCADPSSAGTPGRTRPNARSALCEARLNANSQTQAAHPHAPPGQRTPPV